MGGVAVAVGPLKQLNVTVADALHGAVPGGDVETTGGADRDPAG
jgi:hypothetical protein